MPAVPCVDMLSWIVDDPSVDIEALMSDCEELEKTRRMIFVKKQQFIASASPLEQVGDEKYNHPQMLAGFVGVLKYIDLRCGPVESTSNPAVFSTRTCNYTYAWPGRNPLIH